MPPKKAEAKKTETEQLREVFGPFIYVKSGVPVDSSENDMQSFGNCANIECITRMQNDQLVSTETCIFVYDHGVELPLSVSLSTYFLFCSTFTGIYIYIYIYTIDIRLRYDLGYVDLVLGWLTTREYWAL